MVLKAEQYVFDKIHKPVLLGSETHFPLASIRREFDSISQDGECQCDPLSFYNALGRVTNKLKDYGQIGFFWTPQNDLSYLELLRVGQEGSGKRMREVARPLIESQLQNMIIGTLGFRAGLQFHMKYMSDYNGDFKEFSGDLLALKEKKGLVPSLWISTDFDSPEMTDVFKIPSDMGFFDKFIVMDQNKYGFVLGKDRLDKQTGPLSHIGNRLIC